MADSLLFAGAASIEITPPVGAFLAGYPHARRDSTGVHDPLLSCALYLRREDQQALIIANDVIYVSKASVIRCRERIARATSVPGANILISATHTHSGPKTLDPIATSGDEAVPRTDEAYVRFLEDRIVEIAGRAVAHMRPAEAGLATADASGVGTNRRDVNGAKDLEVPVMVMRDTSSHRPIAAMLVCSMHPTVLHEDSTLISGDFPAMARLQLQRELLGDHCVVLYHTGPAGNQSPRHVTRANTFEEAERLGAILANSARKVIPTIEYSRDRRLHCRSASILLPLRSFPSESEALAKLTCVRNRLDDLRRSNASRTQIRTAEVDSFGAEETLTLARASRRGLLQQAADAASPAEIQRISLGDWTFIAWPGEMFVEFALAVKAKHPNTFLISYANGELQGYLVTREAALEGGYESQNAIFQSPESGELLVQKTLELLS
jgi:hypothetical protein